MELQDQSYQSMSGVEPIYLSLYNTLRDHEEQPPTVAPRQPPPVTSRPPPSAPEVKVWKPPVGRPLPEVPATVNDDYNVPQMIHVDDTSTLKCKILKYCVAGCVLAGLIAATIVPGVLRYGIAQSTGMYSYF